MSVSLFSLMHMCKDELKVFNRGELAFNEGKVQSFSFDRNTGIVMGQVAASMKKKNYSVSMTVSSDSSIIIKHCECPRGNHFCHHMVALGLHASKNVSKTDQLCRWNKPPTAPSDLAVTVDELFPSAEFNPFQNDLVSLSIMKDDLLSFHPSAPMLWHLQEEPEYQETETEEYTKWFLENILLSEDFQNSPNQLEYLIEQLSITTDEAAKIEQATRKQRGLAWVKMRLYRLTSSNFGAILKQIERNSFPDSFFAKLMGLYGDISSHRAIQWGITHEQCAIEQYERIYSKRVNQVGLYLHNSGVLGASPDGLFDDQGVLEVKCPYSAKLSGVKSLIRDKKFYVTQEGREYSLDLTNKQGYDYYQQVQGILHITNRKLCHFFVWSPQDYVLLLIPRNEEWKFNLEVLIEFFKTVYFPKLVDSINTTPL